MGGKALIVKILFVGDIVGRSGRTVLLEHLPRLQSDLALDFTVVNGENAAGGFGITPKIADELFAAGVGCITTGNHAWDKKEIMPYMDQEPRILRPINYPSGTPGKGAGKYELSRGRTILVMNAMGQVFMNDLDNPFPLVDQELNNNRLGVATHAILIDIHAEATSEKMAMGHFADGRASLVVGTHSHVPTADAHILKGGTAYQTDAGMTGDYDSVIGMEKEEPLRRFTRKIGSRAFSPALGKGTLCAVYVETDDKTGLAKRIEPVRIGGMLQETVPVVG